MAEVSRIKPVERATGRSWDEWLEFLNALGAKDLSHAAIAEKVQDELDGKIDNPGWWAQSVTVTYEQHIGRRVPGQRSDGTFEMSVSRATPLGMQDLLDRWAEFAAADREVLDLIAGDVRVSGTDKRVSWRAKAKDGSAVQVTSEPKKNGTASLIATHTKLSSHELSSELREKWGSIMERFVALL